MTTLLTALLLLAPPLQAPPGVPAQAPRGEQPPPPDPGCRCVPECRFCEKCGPSARDCAPTPPPAYSWVWSDGSRTWRDLYLGTRRVGKLSPAGNYYRLESSSAGDYLMGAPCPCALPMDFAPPAAPIVQQRGGNAFVAPLPPPAPFLGGQSCAPGRG